MTDAERQAALEQIAAEIRACTRCRLHEGRTQAVPGEGSADTEVLFVGEGPGRDEDAQGRPFVGDSGKLLTRLIGSVGWSRDEVFITNVVKCRPPGNRDPQPDEIAACAPFLERQLAVLDPALIVTLGRFSLSAFRPGERIGGAHGTSRPAAGRPGADAFAMYHPAYAVRDRTNEPTLFQDMAAAPTALVDVRRRRLATVPDAGSGPEGVAGAVPSADAAPVPTSADSPAVAPSADAPPPDADPSAQIQLF